MKLAPRALRLSYAELLLGAMLAALGTPGRVVGAIGPDITVGEIHGVTDYARDATHAAMSMSVTACNAGTAAINWEPLPSNQHPVMLQNMYRLSAGRLEQIGQSWLKHGFAALQGNACYSDCSPSAQGLGPHCSDPYAAGQNQGPFLGPRHEVNPFTGFFDGAAANRHSGHVHTPMSHGLLVKHQDLQTFGARYFVEVSYVAADDAAHGNAANNTSFREVAVSGSPSDWTFSTIGETIDGKPAAFAWSGAGRTTIDSTPDDGRLILSHWVGLNPNGTWRYEFAVLNQSSARGLRLFSVPTGIANVSGVGFHAVTSVGDGSSDAPWSATVTGSNVVWSTDSYADNPSANSLRWGTMYNFWFDADAPPVVSVATLGSFMPGPGSALAVGFVRAPAAGDCDANGIGDDEDLALGASDCNQNGLPDVCELFGGDCNSNGAPDDCDLDLAVESDCNLNAIPDSCDIAAGRSDDCNGNQSPDECESLADCNGDTIADPCQLGSNDCDSNGVPDDCQADCDHNGVIDVCEGQPDCNGNLLPDDCDVLGIPGGTFVLSSGPIFLSIPDGSTGGVEAVLNFQTGGTIVDVNVTAAIVHSWVADLVVEVHHGDLSVVLWSAACGSRNDIDVRFDDQGASVHCNSPTMGDVQPVSSGGSLLSAFQLGEARGEWRLLLRDVVTPDPGALVEWSVEITIAGESPVSTDWNSTGVPDECESCTTVFDCPPTGICADAFCHLGLCWLTKPVHGDVDGTGEVDIDDLLCVLAGFLDYSNCPMADFAPCGGNGIVDVDDLISELEGFAGIDSCCGP